MNTHTTTPSVLSITPQNIIDDASQEKLLSSEALIKNACHFRRINRFYTVYRDCHARITPSNNEVQASLLWLIADLQACAEKYYVQKHLEELPDQEDISYETSLEELLKIARCYLQYIIEQILYENITYLYIKHISFCRIDIVADFEKVIEGSKQFSINYCTQEEQEEWEENINNYIDSFNQMRMEIEYSEKITVGLLRRHTQPTLPVIAEEEEFELRKTCTL